MELGASWLHDAAHNPLASLAIDNHLATAATNHADQTLFRDAIRWGLSFSRLVEGADETDLSLRGLAADMQAADQDRMVIGGFDTLIRQLANGLDLRLGHPVQTIRQGREGVSVRVGSKWLRSKFAIVTRWGSDPWARGAYSYRQLGHDDRLYHQLAAAMGRLHFAGEHTSANQPATVAGAYCSGLRAAREVLSRF